MQKRSDIRRLKLLTNIKLVSGFTLAETLAALIIAMLIMSAAVAVYSTVRKAETAVNKRLKEGFAATEILQRIAEDIDRLAMPSADVSMSIKNKPDIEGFKISQMVIESKYYDKDNKPQTFEKIVWQSRVASDGNSLIIYRAHSGYSLEDKMLDETKETYQREMYIPVCNNATMFAIEVTDGNSNPDVAAPVSTDWTSTGLPPAVKISISFEPRWADALGNMTVPEESIKTRTVAINRFRQIPYTFVYKQFGDANEVGDINDINDVNLPNDVNDVNTTRSTSTERTNVRSR